jgi:single-strand DNA-binding protein
MNTVTITGRLTKDPETGTTTGGTCTASLRVAVDDRHDTATYLTVSCYGKLADSISRYLTRGRLVGVTGRLAQDEWENDGGYRSRTYIVASQVDFLDRPHPDQPTDTDERDEPS